MRRLTTLFLSSVVAFGLLFAVGCDSNSDGGTGTVDLQMSSSSTKALPAAKAVPDSVTEAVVTITEISIVPADDESSEGNANEVGIQSLTDEDFEVDLIELQTGANEAVKDVEVPTNMYTQIRLIVDGEVEVTFDSGNTESVMIASGQQTGLKVNVDEFSIDSPDDRVELTINWDVDESLKGDNTGRFVFVPTINDATVDTGDASN